MASLSLVFDLLARDSASPAFKKVGESAEKAGRQTSAFGSLTAKAMGAAAGAIAGVGIGALLGGAVKAASNLNETVNKTNVIFGSNAREIRTWAQGSARNFGLSEQAALNAASGFGNMLTQLGYTSDAAVAASTNTVKLAADLGSFNNLETEDVLDRISAALRGEYDSLQLLIPNINAARVEQEAMAATGKTTASALTAQEKATATLAIVQRDGAAAANDFAETSDGLANSQKILNAEWQDAQARLGQLLVGPMTGIVKLLTNGVIPAFEGVVDVVGGAVDIVGDIPGPVLAGVAAFAAIVALKKPLTSAFETVALKSLYLRDSIKQTTGALGGFRGAVSGALTAIDPASLGIGLASAAFVQYAADAASVEARLDAASDAGREFRTVLAEQGGELNAAAVDASNLALEAAGLVDIFDELGVTSREALRAMSGDDGKYEEILASLREVDGASLAVRDTWANLFGIGTRQAMDIVSGKATENADAFSEMAGRLEGVGEVTVISTGAFGEWAAAQEGAQGATAETTAAVQESQEAIDEWIKSLASVGESFIEPLSVYTGLLDEKTAKEREQAEATAAATDSGEDSWEDYASNVSVSLDEYAAALEEQIANQENWRLNLVTISQRGGTEVAQILAQMGAEGADITAAMAGATEEDFQRMAAALIREAGLGGEGATAALDQELRVMAAVGAAGSRATVAGIARELGIGANIVRDIAAKYGINLAAGINPLLSALGKGRIPTINGQRVPSFFDGGFTGEGGKFTPAGIVHGGEFVLTKEQTRKAGVPTLRAMAKYLDGYAAGGFVSVGDVPGPSSTRPYRPPLSTGGDATMQREFEEVKSFLAANLITSGPGGPATPNGVGGLGPAAVRAANFVRSNWGFTGTIGGYAYRNIAGTNQLSKHALGKAIDVMTYANMGLGQSIANYFAGPGRGPFGVDNVIWNRRIHSGGGWGPYYGASPHTDHPHIDFYKTGTDFVERTGPAIIHRGEAVLTAEENAVRLSGRPLDLSDRTIDRLAVAMVRGAGAAIGHSKHRDGINARSAR